jgi:hypothetical protein
MVPTEPAADLSVGDSVIDSDDDDPDEAIVIDIPAGATLEDWEYETDSGTATAADGNPNYPADAQLVVIVFRSALAETVPDWQEIEPEELAEKVDHAGIKQYGFPTGRLERIEPGAMAAEWLDGLADRFADAGWTVTQDDTELTVEQFDEEYRITADGTVEGEGEYRTPLENIVEMERS